MRISDWSSDVCSSDLRASARSPASRSRLPRSRRRRAPAWRLEMNATVKAAKDYASDQEVRWCPGCGDYAILRAVQKTLAELGADTAKTVFIRSEEHTSELQSLMRISYAVFCLKKNNS